MPCYRDWCLDAAVRCGYRPIIPVLVKLLAQRKTLAAAELLYKQREAAARREWLRGRTGGIPVPGAANGIPAGGPYSQHLGLPQPHMPPAPQPDQPTVPGQPPR